ncbi:MAG: methyltransferase domain-containing protein [Candidatus Bathycorpusculaceae bacterium]
MEDRKYDLVLCFATLHYVKEIEKAIKDLFNLVDSEEI